MTDYLFMCNECGWRDNRYSNLRVCPKCGARVVRANDKVICFHGTTKKFADKILAKGFKADSWFAKHMEDALRVGGNTILAVQFNRKDLPTGWQFHALSAILADEILQVYLVKGRRKE